MKFSVVVPIYGVEKYLEECINSVLSQTYTDFELILVDDKSPDNCPAICDAYAEKDSRIKVIHKPENEGVGFARNTGLSVASGDYVLFVDSDDSIKENLLEECLDYLEDDMDILAFGADFRYEDENGAVTRTERTVPECFCAKTPGESAEMFAILNRSRIFQYPWNKVFKREFLIDTGVQFEKTKLIEDFLFNIAVFPKAKYIKSIDKPYYNYRKPRHETLVSKYSPDMFELFKRKHLLEKQFLIDCGALEEFRQLINQMYIKHFVSVVIRNSSEKAGLSKKEQKARLLSMCGDEVAVDIVNNYPPSGKVYKILCGIIRKKNVTLMLAVCLCIGFARENILPFLKKALKR